jgi:sulfopyruvate decarboxylase subunit beta
MKTNECMKVLAKHRGDAVVVCALGMAANEWWAVTQSEDSFYMHGAMGFAASFALGLALSIPQTPVWVLNSDGSLCMNTGCLITEAGQKPRNLKHFVVDNQCYQTVATMPMVNQDGADYTAIARGAGIQQAIAIDNVAELERKMPEIVAAPGPYFVRLRVEAEPDYRQAPLANYEGPELKYRFGRAMEKKLGIKVFGPKGF